MSVAWWYFWLVSFLVAGSSFVFIAAVVLVRGIDDLRAMIRLLEQHAAPRHGGGEPEAGGGNRISDDQ